VDSYVRIAYGWRVAVSAGTYQLGPAQGRVSIRTGRVGIAARAGHDLLLEVTRWQARVEVPEAGGVAAATVTAELDLASLAVREGTGGARPLSPKDRADIEKQMRKILADRGDAASASFSSARVIPASVGGAIEGTITLRGKTQPARLQVQEPEPGHYRGTATVSQTGLGITPYTGFLGALKVRDEVTVELDLRVA
jgi:polyisoprenoid-binding protein YceI